MLLTLLRLADDRSMSSRRFDEARMGIGDLWCLPWRTIRGLLFIELFEPRRGCRLIDDARTIGMPKSPKIKNELETEEVRIKK